ncbi:trypsin-like serine protease [bacterium]|nr:trypsin-like serine protease [bacterium]
MGNYKIIIFVFLFFAKVHAIVGPIEGEIPKDHPAAYNTVALVKKLKGSDTKFKIFCSGFIVSPQIILTAKHCLGEVQLNDYLIYFGNDTNFVDKNLLREPLESSVYGPKDWQNYFPSFDSAWVRISDLPNANGLDKNLPHFRPVSVLRDPQYLENADVIHLAGYGNQSAELMKIVAGEKKHVAIGFSKYMNTNQVASLVLLEGEKGHSNCHGDSGGPAYAKITNPVTLQKEWVVFGSASGFDLALTPDTYEEKKDDDLFPFIAYCDRSQTLYTFVGDYAHWIESTTKEPLNKVGHLQMENPGLLKNPNLKNENTFQFWCENSTFNDPQWLTVRKLLIDAMENAKTDFSQADIFLNCEKAQAALTTLQKIEFKATDQWQALEPLATLDSLRELKFSKTKIPDFSHFVDSKIEKLTLTEMGLESLERVRGLENFEDLKEMNLAANKIQDISQLAQFKNLTKVNISWNKISNLEPLSQLMQINYLDFSSNLVTHLDPIYGLSQLEVLIGSNNQLVSSPAPANTWTSLEKVYLINNQLTDLLFLRDAKNIQHSNYKGNPLH